MSEGMVPEAAFPARLYYKVSQSFLAKKAISRCCLMELPGEWETKPGSFILFPVIGKPLLWGLGHVPVYLRVRDFCF